MAIRAFRLRVLGTSVLASWFKPTVADIARLAPVVLPPIFLEMPSITGLLNVGQTLALGRGNVTGGVVDDVELLRGATVINSNAGLTYAPVTADIGANLSIRVTAIGPGGTTVVTSAAVGPILPALPVFTLAPTASGTPTVGQVLDATPGTISDGTLSARTWLRGTSAISGETALAYLVTADDVGASLAIRETATNAGGSTSATSTALGPVAAFTVPQLSPAAQWNGTAGTGFGGSNPAAPTDPTRTTAKPALRLLVPPGQRFTDELLVGVAAAANNGGTLIGGVSLVRFHFEGNTVEVAPSFQTFNDANGNFVTYWGYWVRLKKPVGVAGDANLYVEAIPADATMQARVIGPYLFSPQDTLHDLELTINPDVAATGNNYHTVQAAMDRIRLASPVPANPCITITKALTNFTLANVNAFSVKNYITIKATQPVTFGFASLDTSASVDTNNMQRSRGGPLWVKGGNITFDYAHMDLVAMETALGHEAVLDGIIITNSLGPGALYRGGPNTVSQRVSGSARFLECTISNVRNACNKMGLARGNVLSNVSVDIFSGGRCAVGNRVQRHSDTYTNDDAEALTVVYTGSEATATVARSGAVDPSSCTYTFRWGANSRTFTTGRTAAFYAAGLTGDQGYTFAHLVTWINTVLAGLDAGWSATLIDTTGRRASSGSLAGLKGQGFGDTDCKTTARTIVSNFDQHGDFYQQVSTTLENVIVYDNLAYDMQTQNIFLSPAGGVSSRDVIFFNNALGNDPTGSVYFDETVVVSQLGRQNTAMALSHVVIAHNSMPNQGIAFRNDGASFFSTTDAYCLVANNALQTLTKSSTTAGREPGASIRDNHIHTGQTPLAEAVGTTIGGDKNSLFPGFNTGDFTPAGALLTNRKSRRVLVDSQRRARAASEVVGAMRGPA